jgi:hypothetical protein
LRKRRFAEKTPEQDEGPDVKTGLCAATVQQRGDDMSEVWFPEPAKKDDTYAERLESTPSWLARSTLDVARECRSFLNSNLSTLPEDCQRGIGPRLKTDIHYRSAFFELVVARTLQTLGAFITCEPENPVDGTRIDFMARFPDYEVGVEATSPLFDRQVGATTKNYAPLTDIIEELIPHEWAVGVVSLPDLGPSDSKREFKSAAKEMLNVPPPAAGEEKREVERELPEGDIRLTLLSKTFYGLSDETRVVMEALLTTFDDSKRIIREAVEGKRRQARNVAAPVLVAVDGKGISTDLEDFDTALFGRYTQFLDRFGMLQPPTFEADGLFARGEGEPTISGVVAFTEVGFLRCSEPVLYLHPRFQGRLPDALLQLERRTLGANGVSVQGAQSGEFLEILGFVDPSP